MHDLQDLDVVKSRGLQDYHVGDVENSHRLEGELHPCHVGIARRLHYVSSELHLHSDVTAKKNNLHCALHLHSDVAAKRNSLHHDGDVQKPHCVESKLHLPHVEEA